MVHIIHSQQVITTHDPEQVMFENGVHIIHYVGKSLHERENRYGDGTHPSCIEGENSDSKVGFDTALVDCAYTTTNLSLKLMLGIFLMKTESCIQL